MEKAYWNEPDLKTPYPEHPIITWLLLLGGFFAAIALIGILPGIKDWPGPWWTFMIMLAIPCMLAVLCFWLSPRVEAARYNRDWRNAFIENNSDLGLFYPGIDMVIEHLHDETNYQDVNFQSVASALACALRKRDPFDKKEHTSFSWEVLHAYFHFKDASQPLIITACPKK
jgi:hypothetical protein